MNQEGLKRIYDLLQSLNGTFELEPNLVEEQDELVANGISIKQLKNNGAEFLAIFHETFNELVQSLSPDHEVIYDMEQGLVIAKKVIQTNYVIEKF